MKKVSIVIISLVFFLTACLDNNGDSTPKSSANDIVQFQLSSKTGDAAIDTINNTVTIEVAYGTGLASLSPTISVSEYASIDPQSGDAIDFSSGAVDYTVTAEDGTEQVWEVTVTEAVILSSSNDILTFELTNQVAPAAIDSNNHTVAISVSSGTGLTGLTPTITVSNSATISPLSGASVDFDSGPVTYTVEAEDGTEQSWTVTVTEAESSAKDITGFTLANRTGESVIDSTAGTVSIQVLYNSDLTALSPSITVSDSAAISPESGEAVDFSSGSTTYTVTAEDDTTKTWTVSVDGIYTAPVSDTPAWYKKLDRNWERDEFTKTVKIDSEDSVYVISSADSVRWWLIKYNNFGSQQWEKLYNDAGPAMAIDSNNNVYVAGSGSEVISVDGGMKTVRYWSIKKFSSDGTEDTTNWNKKLEDSDGKYDEIRAIAIDSNDNVYVAGSGKKLISSTSNEDIWIKKFSNDGIEDTTNWDKKIDGNDDTDLVTSLAIDSNDNVFVASRSYDLVSDSSGYDIWLKKYSNAGVEDTTNWNKKIDFYNNHDFEPYLAIDSNDNIYLASSSNNLLTDSSDIDWLIKKYSNDGVEDTALWDKIFDGNSGRDSIFAIEIDSNNNIYVAGYGENLISSTSNQDCWVKKFFPNGIEDTLEWNMMFDQNEWINMVRSIAFDSSDNIYMAGYGYKLVNSNSAYDGWLMKYTY